MAITVPRYGDRKVLTEPMPSPRNTISANEETFGGGATNRKVVSAATSLDTSLQTIIAKQRQAADEVRAQDADLKYGLLSQKINADVQKLKGLDALKASEYVQKAWRDGAGEINQGLSADQQSLIQPKANQRYLMLNGSATNHITSEIEKHDDASTSAFIKNSREFSAANSNDPDKVALGMLQQETAFKKFAKRKGMDSGQVKAGIAEIRSETHAAVIEGFMANAEYDAAMDYYKQNKKELLGDERKKYSEVITSKKMQHKNKLKAEKEQASDDLSNELMLEAANTGKDPEFGEIVRLYISGAMAKSDYTYWEVRIKGDPYKFKDWKGAAVGDPKAYATIRELQLEGDTPKGEMIRMIQESKTLSDTERDDLVRKGQQAGGSPDFRLTVVNGKAVEDFGNRYFDNFVFMSDEKKTEEAQKLKKEFFDRVDKEKATGEQIDEIAMDVIKRQMKKQYPGLSRIEDVVHATVAVNGLIAKLFSPEKKTKTKPMYKVTRAKPTAEPATKK